MSKSVDRNKVLETIKVRTALKNDGSWIQKSGQGKKEQDEAGLDLAVETRPAAVREKSYVLSTAMKYKSVDSPLSPHLKETTEDASAIRASGEVILPQKDAQPEGSTVETADDTKPQAHAEERIQNDEAQREKTVANTAEENKEGCADTPAEQSNTDHTEAKSPEDALLEVKMKPEEEPSVATEPANAAHLEDAGLILQPAERSCNERPLEQAAEGVFKAVAVVVLESSHDKSDVINATPGYGAAPQNSVKPIPDMLLESLSKSPTHQTILHPVSESPTQSAANTTVKSVECEVELAAPTEAALKTRAEEAVECEVQPVNNTVVVQSAEKAADQVMELSITDALDFETASDTGAITEPTAEPVPEPVDDPKQSHSDKSNLNQSDDTKITDIFLKPREELQTLHTLKMTSDGKAVCSLCDQIIEGKVKISFSEPLMTCHAECLKCGVCAKRLGDMLTPMFLHDQVIHCDGCFFSRPEA